MTVLSVELICFPEKIRQQSQYTTVIRLRPCSDNSTRNIDYRMVYISLLQHRLKNTL